MGWFLLSCLSLGLNTTNLYSYIRCRMHQRDADKVTTSQTVTNLPNFPSACGPCFEMVLLQNNVIKQEYGDGGGFGFSATLWTLLSTAATGLTKWRRGGGDYMAPDQTHGPF